jgi:hypothetical protein
LTPKGAAPDGSFVFRVPSEKDLLGANCGAFKAMGARIRSGIQLL